MRRFFCPQPVNLHSNKTCTPTKLASRTALIVACDRYEAHTAATVHGPHMAPADGNRMKVPLSRAAACGAFRQAIAREQKRQRAIEEVILRDTN